MLIGAMALAVSGCAQYTPTVKADEAPTGKEAYLYGRFQVGQDESGTVPNLQMGFVFQCVAPKTQPRRYTLRFNFEKPIQVVKVNPATCSFVEIVYTDTDGFIKSQKPAPEGQYRNMQVEAGKAYYLGDFYALIKTKWIIPNYSWETIWEVRDIKNDFAVTGEKMKRQYPGIAGVPTEDFMAKHLQ